MHTQHSNRTAVPHSADVEPLISVETLQARWGVSRSWIYRRRREGVLPTIYLGRCVRFRLSDVEALLEPAHAAA